MEILDPSIRDRVGEIVQRLLGHSRRFAIKSGDRDQATIRLANATDAERIAALCQQLGYSTSREDVQWRLDQMARDAGHAVYVAELSGQVVGWVHVYVSRLVIIDRQAEIGGLVVAEDYRRYGAGRLLMQRAEQWAREKGCSVVYLRSSVARTDAHAFYEKLGYSNFKTSLAFRKVL